MKFMLLIYNRPGYVDELSEADRDALFGEVGAIMDELSESGELIGGEALGAPSATRTLRPGGGASGGAPLTTDGPFIESKEQFAGYLSVDCESIERAEQIAARWPDLRHGGAMEVRAIMSADGADM